MDFNSEHLGLSQRVRFFFVFCFFYGGDNQPMSPWFPNSGCRRVLHCSVQGHPSKEIPRQVGSLASRVALLFLNMAYKEIRSNPTGNKEISNSRSTQKSESPSHGEPLHILQEADLATGPSKAVP